MLSDMKVGELKALAKEKGINGVDGMNKAALLVALGHDSDKKPNDYKEHMKSWNSKKDKDAEKSSLNKVPGKYLKLMDVVKGEN